jgi:hypothetical protein
MTSIVVGGFAVLALNKATPITPNPDALPGIGAASASTPSVEETEPRQIVQEPVMTEVVEPIELLNYQNIC